ncbi:hypothetical protein [Streptomyces thioluteus]|uniref:hypothetical protein n=1 Tax=Streptomyces thioluteus TaxID=66431 RepID=UPI0031EC3F58
MSATVSAARKKKKKKKKNPKSFGVGAGRRWCGSSAAARSPILGGSPRPCCREGNAASL